MGVGQINGGVSGLAKRKFDQGSNKVINVYSRSNKNPRMLPNASAGRRAAKASRSLMATVVLI